MKRHIISEDSVLLKALAGRYGVGSAQSIARKLSEQVIISTKQYNPPVNLSLIFPRRKIAEFCVSKIEEAGKLSVNKNGFIIEVRDGRVTRKRFTLAHEIGHTFFYDLEKSPPQRIIRSSYTKDEETFCNVFASELLMPAGMVKAELNKLGGFSESSDPVLLFRKLADIFKVSVEAMARRLIEDLMAIDGIIVSTRWLSRIQQSETEGDARVDWRLNWWAASPKIIESIYIPPSSKRPRLNLDVVDRVYKDNKPALVQIALKQIKLGNLSKFLTDFFNGDADISVWIHPIHSRGMQISSGLIESMEYTSSSSRIVNDGIHRFDVREGGETIVFFPLAKV